MCCVVVVWGKKSKQEKTKIAGRFVQPKTNMGCKKKDTIEHVPGTHGGRPHLVFFTRMGKRQSCGDKGVEGHV